jgi:hypothetical protein
VPTKDNYVRFKADTNNPSRCSCACPALITENSQAECALYHEKLTWDYDHQLYIRTYSCMEGK